MSLFLQDIDKEPMSETEPEAETKSTTTEFVDLESGNESPQNYVFYCYHEAILCKDADNCEACYELDITKSEDEVCAIHDDYDEHNCEKLSNITCYSRQKFIAYIRPSIYKLYTELDDDEMESRMFALANLCLWNELSDDLEPLNDDEYIEDAYDDTYVCYEDEKKEQYVFSYFRKHGIHLSFQGSGSTNHAEWHVNGLHITN
jgi:hypothetical protein